MDIREKKRFAWEAKVFMTLLFLLLFSYEVKAEEVSGTLSTGNGLNTGVNGMVIAAPTASVAAGTYTSNQSVTLSASGASSIRYTTDGTTPTCSTGSTYSSAVTISATTNLKARACYSNSNSSTVASFSYTLQCATASVSNGSVSAYPTCAISCNSGYSVSGSSCVASGGSGGGGGYVYTPAATTPAVTTPAITANQTPVSNPPVITTTPAPSSEKTEKLISIQTQILNVRSLSGISGKIVGKVTRGTKLTVLEEKNGWYKVEFKKGTTGWVSGAYATILGETPSITSSSPNPPTVSVSGEKMMISVTASSLNVRGNSNISGKIVGKVTRGTKLTVLEEKNGWYKVEFKNGTIGWVSGAYTSSVASGTMAPAESPSTPVPTKTATITGEWVNVRTLGSMKGKIIGKAYKGQTYNLISQSAGWYNIEFEGNTAWIYGAYAVVK